MAKRKGFRVLIATDGSAAAKAAVSTAVRFPWPEGVRAFGVIVKQVPAGYKRSALLTALNQTAEIVAKGTMRALAQRWPDAQVQVVDASPVDGILREASRARADVIVMGWRGHGAVRRLLAGSVSRGVVRRSPCAVLVVRRAVGDIQRIVVGFDASAHARRAVALIATLDPPRGGRVSLVSVVDMMQHVPSHPLVPSSLRAMLAGEVRRINKDRIAQAREALERPTTTLTAAGWKVDGSVTTGAPLRDLLATVSDTRAQLLVVGARGVGGVEHLLLGSVAEGALHRSPVPVLIAR